MRSIFAGALLASAAAVFFTCTPALAAPQSTVLCHLSDKRIDEASGIAAGIRSPNVFYAQNDSGDVNRFFALNSRTCATAATITVTGAHNADWEDIAVARDKAGTPSVWLADVGDNDARRSEVDIYRVPEPRVAANRANVAMHTARADLWRLRYPSGPVNAEAFAVTPTGVAYVITKSYAGLSAVYRVPPSPSRDGVQTLQRVGSITFDPTGTPNPFGPIGAVAATSAAVASDGSLLAVRTYADAYLWRLRGGDIAAALRTKPMRVALPSQPQGEGICFDGASLVIDSEGVGAAVDRIPLPAAVRAASAAESAAGASASTSRRAAPPSSSGSSSKAPSKHHHSGGWGTGLVVLGALLFLTVAFWVAQLTGKRRGR